MSVDAFCFEDIAGKIFQFLFALDGPVNKLLELFGVPEIYWFGTRGTAFFVIILCLVWIEFGWQTIYQSGFLTTKNGFIKDLLLLDGAGFFEKLYCVYAPLLWNAIKSSLLITVVSSFSDIFSLIFVMTKGGPGYGTTTIDYLIYQEAFSLNGNLGEACALSTILLSLLVIVSLILIVAGGKRRLNQ